MRISWDPLIIITCIAILGVSTIGIGSCIRKQRRLKEYDLKKLALTNIIEKQIAEQDTNISETWYSFSIITNEPTRIILEASLVGNFDPYVWIVKDSVTGRRFIIVKDASIQPIVER